MDITIHIPENCEPYATDIKRFVDAMLWKLRKNAHKGRWEDLGIDDAYQHLCGEAEELRVEIESPSNAFDIVFEAADVANYALIIASMAVERSSAHTKVEDNVIAAIDRVGKLRGAELKGVADFIDGLIRDESRNPVEHDDDIPF